MRGLLAPLIKLIVFLVVTSAATYVLAATIANTSFGSTQNYKADFTDAQGLNVGDDKVDQIVKMAPEDPTAGGNPVKLDRRAARTIFMRALEGRV